MNERERLMLLLKEIEKLADNIPKEKPKNKNLFNGLNIDTSKNYLFQIQDSKGNNYTVNFQQF